MSPKCDVSYDDSKSGIFHYHENGGFNDDYILKKKTYKTDEKNFFTYKIGQPILEKIDRPGRKIGLADFFNFGQDH